MMPTVHRPNLANKKRVGGENKIEGVKLERGGRMG